MGADAQTRFRIAALPTFGRDANPYQWALYTAMQRHDADVQSLYRGSVLWWHPDVVHVHWPEEGLKELNALRAFRRTVDFLGVVYLARLLGVPVVWSIHNLANHEVVHPVLESVFWRCFIPAVSASISHSPAAEARARERFPRLRRRPSTVIPHGHYRGLYADTITKVEARRVLDLDPDVPVVAFVGRVKRYKGAHTLAAAFRQMPGDVRLLIAGESDGSADADIRALALADSRIKLDSDPLPDDRLQIYMRAADLVVLPYANILNSGSALLALSFDRPILVPDVGSMSDLRRDVGAAWVRLYPVGHLTADVLADAVRWAKDAAGHPDLADRDWDRVADATLAYLKVVAAGSPRRIRLRREGAGGWFGRVRAKLASGARP